MIRLNENGEVICPNCKKEYKPILKRKTNKNIQDEHPTAFNQMNGGLHWLYTNNNGDSLSVICHQGSYGWEDGKFETMCSWLKDVQGRLNFEQVQRKIKTLKKRELKFTITKKGEKDE